MVIVFYIGTLLDLSKETKDRIINSYSKDKVWVYILKLLIKEA